MDTNFSIVETLTELSFIPEPMVGKFSIGYCQYVLLEAASDQAPESINYTCNVL